MLKGYILQVYDASRMMVLIISSTLRGPLILNLSNTVFYDPEGNLSSFDILTQYQAIEVEVDDMMTLSLPPITNAKTLVVLQDAYHLEGILKMIDERYILETVEMGNVWLNMDEDTYAVNLDELVDEAVVVIYSGAMTRSIPPQIFVNALVGK